MRMVRRLFAESGEGNILCKSYDSIFERERDYISCAVSISGSFRKEKKSEGCLVECGINTFTVGSNECSCRIKWMFSRKLQYYFEEYGVTIRL